MRWLFSLLFTNSRDEHIDKHNRSQCLELLHCMAADVYESSVSIANPPIPTDVDCEYMKTNHLDMTKYLAILLGQKNYRNLTDIQMLGKNSPLPILVSAMKLIIWECCIPFFILWSNWNDTRIRKILSILQWCLNQFLRCLPRRGSDGKKFTDLKFLSDRLSGPLTLYYVMEKVHFLIGYGSVPPEGCRIIRSIESCAQ